MIKRLVKTVLPPGSRGFRIAHAGARALGLVPPANARMSVYEEWITTVEPTLWTTESSFDYEPLVSIVVPVFNPPDRYLLPMVYSVVNQKYANWELLLINASSDPAARALTERCADIDTRIRIVDLEQNRGIALNTNAGLTECKGEYISLLDHDDILSPYALLEVVAVLQGPAKERPTFIYSDEDKLSEDGEYRFDPHFKPDFTLQLLEGVNYLNHLTVMHKSLIETVQGFRTGFDGAQDYDLYLRIMDAKARVAHIPKLLYHWRAAQGSTAQNFETKQGVTDAGVKALEDHFARTDRTVLVSAIPKKPGFYATEYIVPQHTKVSLLVFPTASGPQQQSLIEAVAPSDDSLQSSVQVISVKTGVRAFDERADITWIDADTADTFWKQARARATGEVIIGVQAGVLPKTQDWIDRLAGYVLQNPSVGLVAPYLFDKGSKMSLDSGLVRQDEGLVPLFPYTPRGTHTIFGNNDWPRQVDSVSGRVWAVRKSVSAQFPHDSFDIAAICKVLTSNNLQIVFWPFVSLAFSGDLVVRSVRQGLYNPRLRIGTGEMSLPRIINMPTEKE
jgi:hypothetical protein